MKKILALVSVSLASVAADNCWKPTLTRGLGNPFSLCPGNTTLAGDKMCYPDCNTGYANNNTMTPGVCQYSSCPDKWMDNGMTCQKPSPYGRGPGYSLD